MKNFKQLWAFWIPYTVFIAALAVMIISSEKAQLHLWLNTFHNQALDVFFRYYTQVGEWVPFAVAAGLLFYRFRAALLVFSSQAAAGLTTQLLKRLVDAPRPRRFFADNFPDIDLPQVLGVHLHSSHSFPSGHTTSAFALFLALALLTKKKELHFLYFLLAASAGYSRIYLSQHFASDVLAGSIVGVVMTLAAYYFIDRKQPLWYNKNLPELIKERKAEPNI